MKIRRVEHKYQFMTLKSSDANQLEEGIESYKECGWKENGEVKQIGNKYLITLRRA